MPQIEVEFKEVGPQTVAYVARKGSFAQFAAAMGELMGFMGRQGLQMAGPPFGVYYNAPGEVPEEELSWEVCFPVAGASEGEGVKALPALEVAATVHKGSYHSMGATYQALATQIAAEGYRIAGPAEEVYLSDPRTVAEQELLTEVRFPVAPAEEGEAAP
ncbi:MAG: GyrI-like domain-containing protein [Chloroflexota bacterium]|nr:GyrI-like domain-containing protein [Chloroflexota bacterium]